MAALTAEPIEAQSRRHHDEPPADVVDRVDIGDDQARERLLHHVLGLGQVAQHAKRDVEQVPAVLAPSGADVGTRMFHRCERTPTPIEV